MNSFTLGSDKSKLLLGVELLHALWILIVCKLAQCLQFVLFRKNQTTRNFGGLHVGAVFQLIYVFNLVLEIALLLLPAHLVSEVRAIGLLHEALAGVWKLSLDCF